MASTSNLPVADITVAREGDKIIVAENVRVGDAIAFEDVPFDAEDFSQMADWAIVRSVIETDYKGETVFIFKLEFADLDRDTNAKIVAAGDRLMLDTTSRA